MHDCRCPADLRRLLLERLYVDLRSLEYHMGGETDYAQVVNFLLPETLKSVF